MKRQTTIFALTLLLVPAVVAAGQAPPVVKPQQRPTLRRDRTSRVLLPKIIQHEDERTVTPELIDLLNTSHGGIRKRAALALGRIGYPSVIAPLLDWLAVERNPDMRATLIFALGETESHFAAAALLDRLNPTIESSLVARGRAAEALGKIAANPLSAASLGPYGVQGIADAIVRLLPVTDQPINEDQQMAGALALTALLRIRRPSTIPAIIRQLGSQNATIRWHAANALGRIREGIAPAVPALLPLLEDRDALVRATAARALGVAGDARAVEPLIKRLEDPDLRVRATAVNSLGMLGDARAVEPLVAFGNRELQGYRAFNRERFGVPEQQNVLLLTATALGNLKDPRGLPFLKAFRLADGKLGGSPEAEIAVARFGEAAFFDVPENVKLPPGDWKAMAAYAQGLGQLGGARAATILRDLLEGESYGKPDPRAVSDILNAMAAVKLDGLRAILLEQLKADDVIVRTTAATLLGEQGDGSDEVAAALTEAYKAARADRMNDARIAIIEAADKLKRPMNIMVLAEQTRDEDYVVRLKAAELLRRGKQETGGVRLQIGKVETGHNRDYWRRVAQLATAGKNPEAVIHTRKGDIRLELFAADAPMTVDNFMQLARSGFYNGLTFMRVVPNFVIQGGDPRNDMNGGPGYQIRCEINQRPYLAGTVGMALSGKDTGGSQFFITHSPQPHLDGGYTVFAQVVEGLDVVNRIARDDVIERIEIVESKP